MQWNSARHYVRMVSRVNNHLCKLLIAQSLGGGEALDCHSLLMFCLNEHCSFLEIDITAKKEVCKDFT